MLENTRKFMKNMVPGAGLEPARDIIPRDFKSLGVSLNFSVLSKYLSRLYVICTPIYQSVSSYRGLCATDYYMSKRLPSKMASDGWKEGDKDRRRVNYYSPKSSYKPLNLKGYFGFLLITLALILFFSDSEASENYDQLNLDLQLRESFFVDNKKEPSPKKKSFLSKSMLGEWDAWRVGANLALMADWAQTRDISTTGRKELNPILGDHPSLSKVNIYFASIILVTNIIGEYVLPKRHKKTWYAIVVIAEGVVVARNLNIGVKFKF